MSEIYLEPVDRWKVEIHQTCEAPFEAPLCWHFLAGGMWHNYASLPEMMQGLAEWVKAGTLVLLGWWGDDDYDDRFLGTLGLWRESAPNSNLYGWHWCHAKRVLNPTHWMPLPAPPQEGGV